MTRDRPFSIRVEPTAGSDVTKVFEGAADLARDLRLAWVEFEFNGQSGVAYPRGEGFVMDKGAATVATWKYGQQVEWKNRTNTKGEQ